MPKTTLELHQSCSVQKTAPKTSDIRKMTRFPTKEKIGHRSKGYSLGTKIKAVENETKTTLPLHQSCSVQKIAPKNTLHSKNYQFLTIVNNEKKDFCPVSDLVDFYFTLQNGQSGSKIRIAKNMSKMSLETRQSCSVQKTAPRKHLIFEK